MERSDKARLSPAPTLKALWSWGLILGCLWLVLIKHLSIEWSVNPQYSYGWVVPFLCASVLLRRWLNFWGGKESQTYVGRDAGWAVFGIAAVALFWIPTRLIQEADPDWRLVSWALAIEVVALTLMTIRWTMGPSAVRALAFPILFFLVAIPWPTFVEGPLIQGLTRLNSAIVVNLLGWLGIPAMQHGNVIEVAAGTLGVNEACSGIRSFQTSLMISLFFGEYYNMDRLRRALLIPAGFLFAMVLNVARLLFLAWVVARKGMAAISQYHDPAGVVIALLCSAGLWVLARVIYSRMRRNDQATPPPAWTGSGTVLLPRIRGFQFSLLVLGWFVVAEAGVEFWYRWHEYRLPAAVSWTVDWPRRNATFSEQPLAEETKRMLRYDEGGCGVWKENNGTKWELTYFHWLPGRIAADLATAHTPEICLQATGQSIQMNPGLEYLPVGSLRMPFQIYCIQEAGAPLYVFYCLWRDRARSRSFETTTLTYGKRFESVLAGRRNAGQRSLEIVVAGYSSMDQAKAGVMRQLQNLIKVNAGSSDRLAAK